MAVGIGFGFQQWAAERAHTKQKELMKNAIQWRADDMRAAGINPILAAAQPSGVPAVPVGGFPKVDSLLSTAKQAKKFKPEVATAKNQAAITGYQATSAGHAAEKAAHDTKAAGWFAEQARESAQREAIQLDVDRARWAAVQTQGKFDRTKVGKGLTIWNRGLSQFLEPMKGFFGSSINRSTIRHQGGINERPRPRPQSNDIFRRKR